MLKLIKTFSFVLLLGTAAFTGCKEDDACSRLTDSIAKASGGSTEEVDAWMKETMTGPNGEVPSGDEMTPPRGGNRRDLQRIRRRRPAVKKTATSASKAEPRSMHSSSECILRTPACWIDYRQPWNHV